MRTASPGSIVTTWGPSLSSCWIHGDGGRDAHIYICTGSDSLTYVLSTINGSQTGRTRRFWCPTLERSIILMPSKYPRKSPMNPSWRMASLWCTGGITFSKSSKRPRLTNATATSYPLRTRPKRLQPSLWGVCPAGCLHPCVGRRCDH